MMEKVTGDRHRVREARRPPGDVVLQRQTQELGADIRSGSSKETFQKSLAAPDNRTDEPHAASLSAYGRVTPSHLREGPSVFSGCQRQSARTPRCPRAFGCRQPSRGPGPADMFHRIL